MKVIKTASGKSKIKISKKEWESIGKKAGWMKKADVGDRFDKGLTYACVIKSPDGVNEFERNDLGDIRFRYPEDAKEAVKNNIGQFPGAIGYIIDKETSKIEVITINKTNSKEHDELWEEGDEYAEWEVVTWKKYYNLEEFKESLQQSLQPTT